MVRNRVLLGVIRYEINKRVKWLENKSCLEIFKKNKIW